MKYCEVVGSIRDAIWNAWHDVGMIAYIAHGACRHILGQVAYKFAKREVKLCTMVL